MYTLVAMAAAASGAWDSLATAAALSFGHAIGSSAERAGQIAGAPCRQAIAAVPFKTETRKPPPRTRRLLTVFSSSDVHLMQIAACFPISTTPPPPAAMVVRACTACHAARASSFDDRTRLESGRRLSSPLRVDRLGPRWFDKVEGMLRGAVSAALRFG